MAANTKHNCTYVFDSIGALADHAAARPNAEMNHARESSIDDDKDRSDFFGKLSFATALNIAQNGGRWDVGRDLVEMAVKAIDTDRHLNKPRYKAAYAGSRPSVPRHLAGASRAMIQRTKTPTAHRVIKVGVNVSRVWDVTQDQSVNRGAAILSAIHALESTGDRVEVWAVWRAAGDPHTTRSDHRVLIKPAEAFFSADDIAFPLCHVAFQRRLIWASAELYANDDSQLLNVLRNAYGANPAETEVDDFDVYFQRQTSASQWNDPAAALEYVEQTIALQLTQKEVA